MHVYGLHKLMRERGQDELVNIERRNSVQQVLTRLARDGHVETVDGDTGRRITFRNTDSGSALLFDWLRSELCRPNPEHPRFTAAVALLGFLRPAEARSLLADRRSRLDEEIARLGRQLARGESLPRVLTLEVDLRLATLRAESDWIGHLIGQIDSGDVTWDPDELLTFSTAHQQAKLE